MCLAIPAEVTKLLPDEMAVVSIDGVSKEISVALIEDLAVGDYVIIHVGYALTKINPDEAMRTLELMRELSTEGQGATQGNTPTNFATRRSRWGWPGRSGLRPLRRGATASWSSAADIRMRFRAMAWRTYCPRTCG